MITVTNKTKGIAINPIIKSNTLFIIFEYIL